jgi:hypothetical protein
VLRRVDQACDRFEEAWKAGERPRIEDFLAAAPEAERAALFRELLLLELFFRRRNGESPDLEEYQERFPDHAEQVQAAFEAEDRLPKALLEPQPQVGGGIAKGFEVPLGKADEVGVGERFHVRALGWEEGRPPLFRAGAGGIAGKTRAPAGARLLAENPGQPGGFAQLAGQFPGILRLAGGPLFQVFQGVATRQVHTLLPCKSGASPRGKLLDGPGPPGD